jgi:hypothetical protein
MSTPSYKEDMQQAEEHHRTQQAAGEAAEADLERVCLGLCRLYPTLSPQERGDLRAMVARHKLVQRSLFGCITAAADRIRTAEDGAWLDLGLAAASLEDCAIDQRDWLLAVAFLHAAAEAAGTEPRPHIQKYGELSSWEQPRGGWTPVGALLTNFHTYEVLADGRHFHRRWRSPHLADKGNGGGKKRR